MFYSGKNGSGDQRKMGTKKWATDKNGDKLEQEATFCSEKPVIRVFGFGLEFSFPPIRLTYMVPK